MTERAGSPTPDEQGLAGDAEMPANRARIEQELRSGKGGTPPRGPKTRRIPQVVIDRRVNAIFAAVVAGLQPWEIRRAVAEQQIKERRSREKASEAARQRGAAHPESEALLDVPFVWGDVEIPQRTFDRYLQRARDVLDDQAGTFAKQRSRMLATAHARLSTTYANAVKDKRWYAALKATELEVELFGLREHAKLEAIRQTMMENAGTDDSATRDNALSVPTDPEARAKAFAQLAAAAIASNPELAETLSGLLSPSRSVMP